MVMEGEAVEAASVSYLVDVVRVDFVRDLTTGSLWSFFVGSGSVDDVYAVLDTDAGRRTRRFGLSQVHNRQLTVATGQPKSAPKQ